MRLPPRGVNPNRTILMPAIIALHRTKPGIMMVTVMPIMVNTIKNLGYPNCLTDIL